MKSSYQRLRNENSILNQKIEKLEKIKLTTELQNSILNNSLTGLVQSGNQNQSPLTSFQEVINNNIYAPLTLQWQALSYMYSTQSITQTLIDLPVQDALRGGVDITSGEMDNDDIKIIEDVAEELDAYRILENASKWARLYGGGAIILNTNQSPDTPLTTKQLKNLELVSANRWELRSESGWNPKMESELYAFAPRSSEFFYFYNVKIHRSRVLILDGKEAPYMKKWQLQGWGMSEVERMVEDFNIYIRTKNVIYEILEEAKVDVYKFDGLKGNLINESATNKIRERIELMNRLKSYNKAVVLDSLDDFQQKQLSFSGLAEMMKENRINLASAARMPMTKLFGLSASGLNSGEDDIENYNAMVESEIRSKLKKPLKKLFDLFCLIAHGEALQYDLSFKSLRTMSSVEEETVKTSKHNRTIGLYDRGLIDSQEVGQIMEKEKLSAISTKAAEGLVKNPIPPPNISVSGGGNVA